MSTKYIASNWRLPNEENSGKSDNYGLSFSGSSEYINLGTDSQIQFNTTFSISCWVKTSNTSQNKFIIHRGVHYSESFQDYRLLITSSGNAQLRVNNNSYSVTSTETNLDDGNWHHIVAIYDLENTDGHIYVDNGTPATNTSFPSSLNLNTGYSTYISSPGGSFDMIGDISEVAVFDYALSSTQISTLYGSSSLGAGNPLALKPQPVAYYPLGDNSASNPLTQPNEAVENASVFEFDGGSDFIDCRNNTTLNINGDLTISAWVNIDAHKNYNGVVSKISGTDRNYEILVRSTGKITFYTQATGGAIDLTTSTTVIPINTWTNIIVTVDSGVTNGTKFYFNGVQDATTGTHTVTANSANLNIGRRTTGGFEMDGEISNVAIWNSDQSSEVSNIYNSGVPATSYTNTPTAWYKLDQSANWEADTSGAWQIPDAVSSYPQSFDFDGSNDYINCGDSDDFSFGNGVTDSPFSISAWVNFDNVSTTAGIISKKGSSGEEWQMYTHSSTSNIRFLIKDDSVNKSCFVAGGTNLVTGQWYHIVATYNGVGGSSAGNGIKIYLNGVEETLTVSNNASYVAMENTAQPVEIGRYDSNYFNGRISNSQIYNTELSSSQVETLYNNGVPLTNAIASDNLKAWYKLDNTATFSTNWSIPDASGNGNTGTSSGMTEQNLVNNNVSALNGESSGMTSASLILTDLTRNLPYDSYSFSFDALSGDYIDCGSASYLNGLSEFSLSCWFKLDTATNSKTIISDWNYNSDPYGHFGLQTDSASGSTFGLRLYIKQASDIGQNSVITGGGVFTENIWYNVIFTYNAGTVTCYKNGIPISLTTTGTIPTTLTTQDGNLNIGKFGGSLLRYWDGKISNISIFNEALTSTEVMKLYSNGMPQDLSTFTPAPVAWWTLGSNSFFNGSNFICKDLIGSNDGTSVNAGVDALQGNTPRSEANGTGTNMDIPTNLEGTTKYSSNNSWSINMSESARVADTP